MLVVGAGGAFLGPIVNHLALRLPPEGPRLDAVWLRRRAFLLILLMPLLAGFLAWHFGPSLRSLVGVWYLALFLLIAAIDLEHRLVLDRVIAPAIILAPVTALLWGLSPLSIGVGGTIEFLFFLLSALVSRGRGIGVGDVKLGAFLGLITGYPLVITGLMATAVSAGLVSGILLLLRIRSLHDYIPYAPFMVLGTAVALLSRA
ncbi:MAG TPA: prepilin peptidase [Dehalococcoidia bacterium]|nr:prepilin peptidase [Dehalococcoidia bacterium]